MGNLEQKIAELIFCMLLVDDVSNIILTIYHFWHAVGIRCIQHHIKNPCMQFWDIAIFKKNQVQAHIWYKMDFILNCTEKVIDNIIVELDELKLVIYIHYGWKISRNYSKLGSNCKILINPAKQFLGMKIRIFFPM